MHFYFNLNNLFRKILSCVFISIYQSSINVASVLSYQTAIIKEIVLYRIFNFELGL